MTRGRPSKRSIPIAVLAALALGCASAVAAGGAAAVPSGFGMYAPHGVETRGAPSVSGSPAKRAPYSARLLSCRRSARLDGRVAAVAAAMRPIAGGTRLALRIDLAQRPLGVGRWTLRTDVPGLSTWTSPSDPAIGSRPADVFKYHQAVGRLVVGFAYRFRVGFRWLDANGAIVRQASATTRPCREPDLRPDLLLPRVKVAPTMRPNVVRYTVVVRNDGRSAARNVVVAATFAGVANGSGRTRTVKRLNAGATARVTFAGPPCATGVAPPSFVVDPANAIEESRETNNQLVVACPAT